MKLFLDYTQRLNLHALMGAQRATLDDLRIFWRLQDRLDLAAEEKAAIDYKVIQQPNGQAQVQWDPEKAQVTREYEFEDADLQRLARMLKEWQPGFMIGADRRWIEPLMKQFDSIGPPSGDPRQKEREAGLGSMAMSHR